MELPVKDLLPGDVLNSKMHGLYRGLVGKLLWVSGQSRPDVSFEVNQLSLALCALEGCNVLAANRVVQYPQKVLIPLLFRPIVGLPQLIAYSDASFATGALCSCTQGYLLFVRGKLGSTVNLLAWGSKKIKRVVRSTFAGELLAVSAAIDKALLGRLVL